MTIHNLHNSLQILLIDQDDCIRESLKSFFDQDETRLLIFRTAEEGLNSLGYQEIDVVISDYFLPDMNGINLLRKVHQINPQAIRILMTTILTDELEEDVRKNSIDRLVEKPITVTSLKHIIGELIQQKKRTRSKNNE